MPLPDYTPPKKKTKTKATPTPRSSATWTPPDQADRQRAFRASGGPSLVGSKPAPVTTVTPSVSSVPSLLGPQIPGYTKAQSDFIWGQVKAATLPAEQKIAEASTVAGQKAIQGYYGALTPLLERIVPQVQAGYTQAAELDALLGRGFGGTLASGDAATNAANAATMNLTGGTMPPVDNSPVGRALGWLGAGLEAQGLNVTGAAAGAAAQMMPGQIAAMGGEAVTSLARAQQEADREFSAQRANLAAQIPGLVLKYGAEAVDQALKASQAQQADIKIIGDSKTGYFSLNTTTGKLTRPVQPGASSPSIYSRTYKDDTGVVWGIRADGGVDRLPGNVKPDVTYSRVYKDDTGVWRGIRADGTGVDVLPGDVKPPKIQNITTSGGGIMAFDPASNTYTWIRQPTE